MNQFVACIVLAFGFSQAPTPTPLPDAQVSAPAALQPVPAPAADELFKCVKYRGLQNVAPCAVPVVVSVPDPCQCLSLCKCGDKCNCASDCKCSCDCKVKTVAVKICVPKTCCDVKPCVTTHGNVTRFDYGKYAVNVRSGFGRLVVSYDD